VKFKHHLDKVVGGQAQREDVRDLTVLGKVFMDVDWGSLAGSYIAQEQFRCRFFATSVVGRLWKSN
jgi:hypothetical protein